MVEAMTDDDDLTPLPDDFVVPDDASALAHDRAAHRISGLPEFDPIVVRSIFAAVSSFVCTFAMYAGIMSLNAGCATEAECNERTMSLTSTLIVIFTPVLAAVVIILATRPRIPRRARITIATVGIVLPVILAVVYYLAL